MNHSRRQMLAATSSLAIPLLAGCTGLTDASDSNDGSSDGGNDGGGGGGGGGGSNSNGGEGTSTAETEEATATPEPSQPFLDRTRRVMNEIQWFATEYDRAIRNYQLKAKPVQDTIEKLREREELAQSDVEELRSRTEALSSYVNDTLTPHFEVDSVLRSGYNRLVKSFESGIAQDDDQATEDALSRLAIYYNRVTSSDYISQNLSGDPIEEPLHRLLQSSDGDAVFGLSYPQGDDFTAHTFSDDYIDEDKDRDTQARTHVHSFDTGQTLYAHAHKYGPGHSLRDHENEPDGGRIFAFSDGSVDLMKDTEAWRELVSDYEPLHTNIFEPVIVRDGRVDFAYVMSNKLVTSTDGDKGEEQFLGQPILLQRFADESTAQAAMDTLLQTTLQEDGTTTLEGREWTRVFYDINGPNLYANAILVGEFILTTSVSTKPHGQRSDEEEWPEQLTRSWLGMEVAADGSTPTDN